MSLLLTDEQEFICNEALKFIYNSSEQVFQIAGYAGTGKSVLLNEIVNRTHYNQYQIMPMAFTGAAANVMRMKGFTNARSIHSWLYELVKEEYKPKDQMSGINTSFNTKEYTYSFVPREKGCIPNEIKLMVIDEGYMVPDYMKSTILKHGIKVIVCGDPGQLPPIGGNSAFLTSGKIYYLTKLMRQSENNPIIYLANRARKGQPIHCGLYGNNVLVIEDKDLTNDMVLGCGTIICGTNRTRDNFNNTIRILKGYDKFKFPVIGERVICRNNNWQQELDGIALTNGLAGVISSPIGMTNFDGNTFKADFLPDIMNIPFKNLSIDYKFINANYDERTKIKDSKFSVFSGEKFEYAYAITTHLSQGSEYPCGIYFEEFLRSNIQNQLNYTGITRMKQRLIYVKKSRRYF